MAEAKILYAVRKMADLLIDANLLQGAEEQVKLLKDELQCMQRFVRDASKKKDREEKIRGWLSDVADVTHDADAIIDALFLKVETAKRCIESRGELAYIPKHPYTLIAKQIELLRSKLRDIEIARERYGIQDLVREETEQFWRELQFSVRQNDKQLVGVEEDVELLLRKVILEKTETLSTTGIVGAVGIGKSTLARRIYELAVASKRYVKCVWVAVSGESMTPKDVIKEVILNFLNPLQDKLEEAKKLEELPLSGIQQELQDSVEGAQLFLVLDDVRQEAQWESIATVFTSEDKGSALLLTSHNEDIVKHAGYVHEMKTLDPNKSWDLFTNKAFIDRVDGGKLPKDLDIIGREILKKCDGLPLAIALVGGLLRDKNPSKRKWDNVLNDMNTNLGSSSILSTILELSYRDFPPQLKSCFQYLGLFKERVPIRAEKLVQVWIAQGLVVELEEEEEETKEEISRGYLDELINRNMVQVHDFNTDGRVKNCCIHDLVRELSITKAKKEIGLDILKEDGKTQSLSGKPQRHLAIYGGGDQRSIFNSKNINQNETHVLSLFFHGVSSFLIDNPSYLKSFELLKILDFEDLPLKSVPDTIGLLISLKYLGLRNTKIKSLPESIGRLKNLEVLDVTKVYQVEVDDVLWEMESLRHIHGENIYSEYLLKTHTLKNLQTLGYIYVENLIPAHLIKMKSLRKLSLWIVVSLNFDGIRFYPLLDMLENLVCLEIKWGPSSTVKSLELNGLDILQRVTKLKLSGVMKKLPRANELPPNLSYLTLSRTCLYEDPMPELEKLSKLVHLKLDCAYIGRGDMVISENGFPKLQTLLLYRMWDLKNVRVGKGGIPDLKKLMIRECNKKLGTGFSEELRWVTTFLQEIIKTN
ncbi:hypothetical protein MIMGU_mgv1a020006mg [Erythranthe guttata]|uniref:AAA+ ATPase domain-containing protein n=1 Tax=Erythranthe guttata TaxID=4155 RepID=A0A022RKY5_ERYGU|nr:hypothetical protein MIMGU_mgv1a020006mg [Erythranthe guttata]